MLMRMTEKTKYKTVSDEFERTRKMPLDVLPGFFLSSEENEEVFRMKREEREVFEARVRVTVSLDSVSDVEPVKSEQHLRFLLSSLVSLGHFFSFSLPLVLLSSFAGSCSLTESD